jgi:MFS family permease
MTRSVNLVLVAIFATFAVQVMVLILVPLKAVDLGLPPSTAAGIVAAWGLLGIVADLPGSALSDLVGRRKVIAMGGMTMAMAAVLLGASVDMVTLLAGTALFGLGQALSFGPSLAFLTEVAPPLEHDKVQGVNGAAQGISSISGALLAGLFAAFGLGVAFVPVLALAAIATIAVLAVPEKIVRPRWAGGGRDLFSSYGRALRMNVRRPPIAFASLLSVLYSIVFLVVAASVLPLVLVEIEGLGVALAALLVAFRNLVSAALSLTFAPVSRRYGVTRTVKHMSWLAALGTALLAFTTGSPILVLIPLAIQAAGMAYGAAAANVLVKRATAIDERALGMSSTTVASRFTVLVVPLMLGPLIAPPSAGGAFLLAAALAVPVILSMYAVAAHIHDREDGEPAREGSVT